MLQECYQSPKAAATLPHTADAMQTSDQTQEPTSAARLASVSEPSVSGAHPGIQHSHLSDAPPPPPPLLQSADPPGTLAAPGAPVPQANKHGSSLATSGSPQQTMTPKAAAAPGCTQVLAAEGAAQAAVETAEAMQWQATDANSQQQATDFVSQQQQQPTSIIHPAIPVQANAGLHPSLPPQTHQNSLALPQPHHPSASAQPSMDSHLLTDLQVPHGSDHLFYEANETAAGSYSRSAEDVQLPTAYSGQRFSPEQAEAPAGPLEDAAPEELMLSDLAELLADATAEPADLARLHCSGGAQQQSMPLQHQQPTYHDLGARPDAAEQVFEAQDILRGIPQNHDLLSQTADGLNQEAGAIVAPAGSPQNPTEDRRLAVHVFEHLDSNLLSEGAVQHAPASEELQNGAATADSLEADGLACPPSDPLSDMPATGSRGPDAVHDSMVLQPQNALLPGEASPQQNGNDLHAVMPTTVEKPGQPLEQNDLSVYNAVGTKKPVKQVDDVACSEDAIKRQCVTLQGLI